MSLVLVGRLFWLFARDSNGIAMSAIPARQPPREAGGHSEGVRSNPSAPSALPNSSFKTILRNCCHHGAVTYHLNERGT